MDDVEAVEQLVIQLWKRRVSIAIGKVDMALETPSAGPLLIDDGNPELKELKELLILKMADNVQAVKDWLRQVVPNGKLVDNLTSVMGITGWMNEELGRICTDSEYRKSCCTISTSTNADLFRKTASNLYNTLMELLSESAVVETGGKKCKQSQSEAVHEDYLGHKKKQSEKEVEASLEKKNHAEKNSVEKCLDTIDAMEELTDEEKAAAAEVFESEMNREVFMMQKNLNMRLIWLRRKLRQLAST